MKTLAILMLLCTSLYGADGTTTTNVVGDITTQVYQQNSADGKLHMRRETVYRGKVEVMQSTTCYKDGKPTRSQRCYYLDGKLVMFEYDEDGDGFFESFSVYSTMTGNFEKFMREADGSVKPLSTESLDAIKKKWGSPVESSAEKITSGGGAK
jgi:hypothetical protein